MSAGELLRAEAESKSGLGNLIGDQLKVGANAPQEIIISLLKKELIRQDKQLNLIDGFPRKVGQAIAFEEAVCPAAAALWLNVPDDVLLQRLLERNRDSVPRQPGSD
jgi:adenylate kinase family enzyme